MGDNQENNVWRLQTKTEGEIKNITNYCLKNDIAALGWSLRDTPQKERESISTFDEYKNHVENYEKYNLSAPANHFGTQVQVGDLIWMRGGGKYYIGRVCENSEWFFNPADEATNLDACNQRKIVWYPPKGLDESDVPGAINTAFIRGTTFQRILKSGIFEYSALLYDELANTTYYKNIEVDLSEKNFYSLLLTGDCEDLLCLWLYQQKGYICIPSTNKIATQLYECVLIDPKTGMHIYPQVKKGNDDIYANEYTELKGEVWLFTTEGRVLNLPSDNNDIYQADPTTLYEFALGDESQNILPPSIKKWISFLKNHRNENANS